MATEPVAKRRRLSPPVENGRGGVPGFAKWNLEQDYEKRARKSTKKDVKHEKLPVKTAEGWQKNEKDAEEAVEEEKDDDKDSFMASDDEDGDSGVADIQEKAAPPKPQLPPKEQIRQAKEKLAAVASNISEDPEENYTQLGQLGEIANSENATVKKLALGTQLAVYKDIIPGYRIRPMTKDDMAGKMSKDVRRLRSFEHGLLAGYTEYVKLLAKLTQGGRPADASVFSVAMACACNLLVSVPHFNCRNDLIGILVRKISGRGVDADFKKCCETLEQLFRDDEEGHASLEAVTQLTKAMKTKNYQIHESVLNTFLHLRLLSEFGHKASTNSIDKDEEEQLVKKPKAKREFRTKRERKVLRERKEVEKEMKQADAAVSYEERDKNQAETLKLVFVAYFRILKARIQHLMGAVLEGLAKYSHLINQEFFGDILEALKDLINDAESLMEQDDEGDTELDSADQRNLTRERLLCIITAFALLQGQIDVVKSANSLSLDLNFFITHLYRTLLPLAMNPEIELSAKTAHLQDPNGLYIPVAKDTKVNVSTTAVLLLRSLQGVLLPPTNTKAVPPVRVAAFSKQLMSSALHVPPKSALAILTLLQQVTKTHGNKIAGIWNTEERKGDGVFDAQSLEVESSNPFAATVWEGELLRLHFDPKVREVAKSIEGNVLRKD
ncbi:nucleolar complex-associated protein 3 [Acrodontium crateriforme]|uniref:Nucleolar complex-associated protein 3 n=1 Tax=Acrodontium crateriforme TaxID=150365 RepID=A0AAQ3RBB2_9PEZI|nr:nucleolar complex-associated protein 3 [Acrodontium crateriforme]